VAQEVFVAAWRQLPELRDPDKLRGWLAALRGTWFTTPFAATSALRCAGRGAVPRDTGGHGESA